MANNEDNIRFYGDENDGVYVAPLGTVLPVNLDPLGPDFEAFGLLSEDGIEEDIESEVAELRVHQGYRVARSKVTGTKHTMKVIGAETNKVVRSLRFPAATTTTAGGINTTRGIEKSASDPRVFVVDTYDGGIQTRKIYIRAEVTERATLSKKANEATLWEFTVTNYGEIIEIDNDPALAGGPAV